MPGLTFGEVGPIRGLLFPSSCLGATRESLPLSSRPVDYLPVLPASETSQRAEMASNKGRRSQDTKGCHEARRSPPLPRHQGSSEGTEGCLQGMDLLPTMPWGVAWTLWRPKRRLRAVPSCLMDCFFESRNLGMGAAEGKGGGLEGNGTENRSSY